VTYETLRPGFADELLARLERERRHVLHALVLRGGAVAAASLSLVLVAAARRRSR
jgi:hypothetical protein